MFSPIAGFGVGEMSDVDVYLGLDIEMKQETAYRSVPMQIPED